MPVTHPSYPLTALHAQNAAADAAVAKGRIRYGDAGLPFRPGAEGASPFDELRAWLLRLVDGGPTGTPMWGQHLPDQAFDDSGSPSQPEPQLDRRSILDWLAVGAAAPATAQLLGLYVIDDTAQAGEAYDYLVLADFDGAIASYGDPLAWLRKSPLGRSGMWPKAGVYAYHFRDVESARRPALERVRGVSGCPLDLGAGGGPLGSITAPGACRRGATHH